MVCMMMIPKMLRIVDPKLFGTVIMHTIIKFKWDSFAWRGFYFDFGVILD